MSRLREILKDEHDVLADTRFIPQLTKKEVEESKANELRQALYSQEEQDEAQFDDAIHIHTEYPEDMPGISIEEPSEIQDGSSIEHPLFFEEGIDTEALYFVLNIRKNEKESKEQLDLRDKPLVATPKEGHFEIMDTYIDSVYEKYKVNRKRNGVTSYDEYIDANDFKDPSRVKEQKAMAILRKNLANRQRSYKLFYKKADSEQDKEKKLMYTSRAKDEFKAFLKVSKTIDRIKELNKEYRKKIQYQELSVLLNRYVNYQQHCLANDIEIAIEWEGVKQLWKNSRYDDASQRKLDSLLNI